MALRVLGYKTVVEAKGTWPTNYIAKAEELDLLEDITYGTYAAGAARGNVALLIWNMLRLPMWDVSSESEGDGLTYQETLNSMLNRKFKDYRYYETIYEGFTIETDGTISVDLRADSDLEYAKTDFYTFVPGSEVEVLINIKDDTLLSMVETDEYKYVEGGKVELDEEYDEAAKNLFLNDEDYTYAYGLVDGKTLTEMTKLVVDSEYIYELDDSKAKYIKYNGTAGEKLYYDDDDMIVIKDGEFASIKDLEVGDVWSEVTVYFEAWSWVVNDNGTEDDETDDYEEYVYTPDTEVFYVISGAESTGKLTKVVGEYFENPAQTTGDFDYHTTTIAGEEYYVADNAVYFLDADEEEPEGNFIEAASVDMKNEEVTFVTDLLGRVVAVTFDGDLNGGDASNKNNTVAFYALKGYVEYEGAGVYTLVVENEDGEETLTFAKGKGASYYDERADLSGQFALVQLNDDGEIVSLYKDAKGTGLDALKNGKTLEANQEATDVDATLVYDLNKEAKDATDEEKAADDDLYTVEGFESVKFDDNKLLVGDDTVARVNDDTVVVTLVYDDNDTTTGTNAEDDDEFRVEFTDISALKGMKNDPVIVITDRAVSNFARAKYVVIFDEVSSTEEDLIGIVKDVTTNKLDEVVVTIVEDRDDEIADGVEYIMAENVDAPAEDLFVIFSIEENDDGVWEITSFRDLEAHELDMETEEHAYVKKSASNENSYVSEDGREIYDIQVEDETMAALISEFSVNGVLDLDSEDVKDELEDARIFIVNVVEDDDEQHAGEYYADNYEEVAYDDVKVKELDRIAFRLNSSNEVEFILIIRGMAEIAE